MSGQSLAMKLLEGAREWARRLPTGLAGDVAVDVGGRRLRLSHGRVEAVVRQLLRNVKHLEVREWTAGEAVYDVRLSVKGWKVRVETTLERVELSAGRYRLWLRTPGAVELEESRAASSLVMGVLRAGAGRAGLRTVAERLLPAGLTWNGQVLTVEGRLPAEGLVSARSFEQASLVMAVEHVQDGLWLGAEVWPGLMDLLQALFASDARRPPEG